MASNVQNEKRNALLMENIHSTTCGMWSSNKVWWSCLATLCVLAVATRMTGLDNPPGTTWDEVHFGTFGNYYINRTYFHDVHPPLGKMIVAAALRITGYQATFPFTISTLYPPQVPYVMVRAMLGLLGALLVPLAFLTVWQLTQSLPAAFLAGLAVLTDHYLHRLCTLILLDAPLLLAILASVYCSFAFHNTKHKAWSMRWWAMLASTGVCLGTVMSIKYVGVFTVVFVGVHTAYQLCVIVSHSDTPLWHVIPHTLARATCLILLPVLFYLATFLLHFAVLTQWSPDTGGFYHTRFTSSFNNTEYDNVFFPKHLEYGANITLKNSLAMSGYLESWYNLFPSEFTAPCQQVTLTNLRDPEVLEWTLRYVNVSAGQVESFSDGAGHRRVVRNGDHMVLTHQATGRSLRTHGHRAPVTKRHFQVCGYGDDGEAGPFETWQIVVPGVAVGVPLETMMDNFMFKSFQMKCFLANPGNVELPKTWAYMSAKEVTCTKNTQAAGLLWHVNWVNSTRQPLTRTASEYSMGVWEKVVFQHQAMILGNSGLKPSKEELGHSARPWMWPLMYRLQTLCAYNLDDIKDHHDQSRKNISDYSPTNTTSGISSMQPSSSLSPSSHAKENADDIESSKKNITRKGVESESSDTNETSSIYPNDLLIQSSPSPVNTKSNKNRTTKEIYAVFMHNPLIAYFNLVSFVLTLMLFVYHFYRIIRGVNESSEMYDKRKRTVIACFWIVSCWSLHYLPFFTMSRILYTHHYCPAYCYSCMLTGVIFGHLSEIGADLWSSYSTSASRYRDLMVLVFVSIPAALFVSSYIALFPLATHMQGRLAYPNPPIKPYLDMLHLGQNWFELGFESNDSSFTLQSKYEYLNKLNFENPDVNASLYYGYQLSESTNSSIDPVAASNFSSWNTRVVPAEFITTMLDDYSDDYDKKDGNMKDDFKDKAEKDAVPAKENKISSVFTDQANKDHNITTGIKPDAIKDISNKKEL